MTQDQLDNNLHPYKERRILYVFQLIFAVLAAGFGIIALFGWIAGLPLLTTFGAGYKPMAPSTALLFLFYGTMVFLRACVPQGPGAHRMGLMFGGMGTVISMLLLVLSSLGIHSSVEHLGMQIAGMAGGAPIGHMSPCTAACFVLIGLSFLALASPSSGKQWRTIAAFICSTAVVLTAITLFLGYLIGKPFLYGTGIIPPSLPSSFGLLILGAALLMLSNPQAWSYDNLPETTGTRTKHIYIMTFIILAAGLITVGYFYLRNFERQYRAEIENQLSFAAKAKSDGLEKWKKERLGNASIFYKNAGFAVLVRRYFDDPTDVNAQEQLETWLSRVGLHSECDRVSLLDTCSNERMSIPAKDEPVDAPIARAVPYVLQSGQVGFVDFYRCEYDQRIYLAVLVPIISEAENRKVGVLALCIDPEKYLYPDINRWPIPSRTGETVIVRREGNEVLFLNELKFQNNTALNLRVSLDKSQDFPSVQAALGQEGIVEGTDYRGVPVIASVRAVPNSPWFLAAKIDHSEMYGPVRNRAWMTLVLAGILLLGMGVSLRLIWGQRRMQYYREKCQAEEDYLNLFTEMLSGCSLQEPIYDEQGAMIDYITLNANASFERILNIRKNDVIGKRASSILPQEELNRWLKLFGEAAITEKPIRYKQFSASNNKYFEGVVFAPKHGQFAVIFDDITESKRAEERLRESEYFFKESQRAAFIGSYKVDFTTGIWESSEVLDRMFGIDQNYCRNVQGWLNIVHPDDREMMDRYLREEVISKRKAFDKEYRIKRGSDGEIRWVNGLGQVDFDSKGNVISMIGTIQDITERKQATETLRESEEGFRTLVENTGEGIGIVDLDERFIYANRVADEIFGMPHGRLAGHSVMEFVDSKKAEDIQTKILDRQTDHSTVYELEITRYDGLSRTLILTSTTRFSASGNRVGSFGIFRDITERKRAEEAIIEAELKYRIIADNTYDWEFWQAPTGKFLYVSPSCMKVTGYEASEFIEDAELMRRLIHPDDKSVWDSHRSEAKIGHAESPLSFRILHSDSSERWIEHVCQPVFDDKGNFIGTRGSNRDVTETKRLQELASRSQRLETAGKIAGQVAHDFNNLLGPMVAYPEMIREVLPGDHLILPYIRDIENAALQMAEINQQLLTLGRRGHYNQEILNLNHIVRQAVHDQGQFPATLVYNMELAENLLNIRGGGAQLHRVVSNLLHNACDAIRDIGRITIKTENYYVDDVTVTYGRVPKGEYVKLTISDTGCGIPDDIVQKIFDPFFTTKSADKKRGSGLGMSVVDAVTKDHGGYIDLSTKVGEGTSFYIYYPICREAISDPDTVSVSGGNEKLLVIDDDDMQREVSTQLLTKMGYKVTTAESGEKALEILRSSTPDLLVLDMIMPPGINGTETYRRALQINPSQRAIIVSGFSESAQVIEAQMLGVGAFVRKPLTRKTLSTAVRAELDRKVKTLVS